MWEQIQDHEFRAAFLKIHEPLTLCFAEAYERKPVMNTMHPLHRRTPIWLDCDTGHDDAFAMLLAARSDGVDLLAISTVYGNAPLENTTYNTRAILKAIGREDVPVYPGASKPSCREAAHAPDIHGASGLDGTHCLPEPTVPARTTDAVLAMYEGLKAEPAGTAWLVAVGALTNIAALFTKHSHLIDHIAGLSIMGGAVGGGFTDAPMGTVAGEGERFGNHTPYAEFNIYCDPEAARAIFSNPELAAKTTLIPLDLTHQFLATSEVQKSLLYGSTRSRLSEVTSRSVKPVRRLFFEILTFFAKTYADVFGLKEGPPLHDPLAVAVAFRHELFVYNKQGQTEHEYFAVDVVVEGEHGDSDQIRSGPSQCGRTIVRRLPSGQPGVTIPRGLDAPALWNLIEASLGTAEAASEK
ncbi:Uridine nucleosidase 1 [Friedmanniomyces endolithicus]|nr:Uridine nucleosidase 1 [Friedmanniomyces endolithicus]KAK0879712.1 Uridine nucleosidase 1 [Friedmanniomyces endolithicus]